MSLPLSHAYHRLTPAELDVLWKKKTERPGSSSYPLGQQGVYLCRQCNAPLYRGSTQFNSGCGWPAFDQAFADAIIQQPDADGVRTEIICANCHAHLGHIFHGEHFTEQNTRHCVNGISLRYHEVNQPLPPVLTIPYYARAYFAAGCFWGVQESFRSLTGVVLTQVGYMGGAQPHPNYALVCTGKTAHAEAVEILYDPQQVDYQHLVTHFFAIHDASQKNRQGPDIGTQYRSAIFYVTPDQEAIARATLDSLRHKGFSVATELVPFTHFWAAEEWHQDYFQKRGQHGHCHLPQGKA